MDAIGVWKFFSVCACVHTGRVGVVGGGGVCNLFEEGKYLLQVAEMCRQPCQSINLDSYLYKMFSRDMKGPSVVHQELLEETECCRLLKQSTEERGKKTETN